MYSLFFFIFVASKNILITAAIRNAISAMITMYIRPKNKPNAPMNLTSPNPIASFPAISPPIRVIIKNTPPPINIPEQCISYEVHTI